MWSVLHLWYTSLLVLSMLSRKPSWWSALLASLPFTFQLSTLLPMSWIYLKCLPPSYGRSSAFNPEALVLSAVLSVCAHIKLKVPFSGPVYWVRLCLSSLACGTAGSHLHALPAAQKPGGSPLAWQLTFIQMVSPPQQWRLGQAPW